MVRRPILVFTILAALAAPAIAQSDRAAQVRIDAMRAGDEDLSCAQLERELIAIVRNDGVRAYLAEQNAIAPRAASAVFDRFEHDALAAQSATTDEQIDRLPNQAAKLRLLAERMTQLQPYFARGVRVRDLARAHTCRFVRAWEAEAPVAPGPNCRARC
jgi:hypothetical protein